jgi:peptidoglycan/LPS O-acetylase OafA/YrhL
MRAIAVLAVVGFHAFPTVFRGGFVGVDVFFVISGFLISGILFAQSDKGGIRISGFYARRIKRIFPALLVVLATTLTLGWVILFQRELRSLGRHVVAGAGFVSNVQLWNEAGYFDSSAASKPLLHLWSLGVEEQFYIVWPLTIILFAGTRALTLSLIAVSFIANLWLVRHFPSAAFYLPLSRFWELLAGALLAIGEPPKPSALRAWSGMILLAAAVLLIDQERSFPGWWALLPVAGACLLISAGPGVWPNRRFLGNPALVFIGLISYPLYLWHWPLLTFARLLENGTPPLAIRLLAVAASVVLSWLTYRFVELPVRGSTARITPILLSILMAVVALGGFLIYRSPESPDPVFASIVVGNGLTGLTKPGCGITSGEKPTALSNCDSDTRQTPVFALVGDSHAGALFPALVRESEPEGRWMLLARPGCLPLSGVVRLTGNSEDDRRECAVATRIALRAIADNRDIRVVAIAVSARMTGTLKPELSEGDVIEYGREGSAQAEPGLVAEGLSSTIAILKRAGKRVFFVVDNPSLPDPTACLRRVKNFGPVIGPNCSISRAQADVDFARYRALIQELQRRNPQLSVFDPTELLCPDNECRVFNNGASYYSFSDHLSDTGATIVARALIAFMRK